MSNNKICILLVFIFDNIEETNSYKKSFHWTPLERLYLKVKSQVLQVIIVSDDEEEDPTPAISSSIQDNGPGIQNYIQKR